MRPNATDREAGLPRAFYTLGEFAQLCGHHRSWAYRLVEDGKVRVVRGFGKMMVPASEIQRLESEASLEPGEGKEARP